MRARRAIGLMESRAMNPHVCIWCGKHYLPKPRHPNPRRVYCCHACQERAWRRRVQAKEYQETRLKAMGRA
ncbi:hypothetical protein [Methanomassiliicoccus luminyensis]|uniref:hypothetical protein n=1 Tax=Methanomassiliicoccus luminyensis TaxID=1080712 RepID=UPI0011C8C862|nr:hypothetical protein [Methanomassiliicoccus luminyensis]